MNDYRIIMHDLNADHKGEHGVCWILVRDTCRSEAEFEDSAAALAFSDAFDVPFAEGDVDRKIAEDLAEEFKTTDG